MKIMICGSMSFAKEMLNYKILLEKKGNIVYVPTDAEEIANGSHNHDDLESDYEHCIKNDIMRTHFNLVADSDAVLVLNYEKKWN